MKILAKLIHNLFNINIYFMSCYLYRKNGE